MKQSTILLAAVLAAACTNSKSHVATTSTTIDAGPGGPDAGTSTGIPTYGPHDYCGGPDQDPDVVWDGWIEAFTFPEGSDRIRVQIEPDGAGGFTGFFVGGEGPALDAVPRGPDDCEFLCETEIGEHLFGQHVEEGFRYTLQNVTYTDIRLRFDIDYREIFAAWCEAQPPIADEVNPGSYRCLRNVPTETSWSPPFCRLLPEGEPPMEIPCCKFFLCQSVCACIASGCSADPHLITFDLFIEGDVASGTTPFGTGHLQRVDM